MSATDSTSTEPQPIDKGLFYGRFQEHEDAKNKLALKMAYKALDIPQDDMQINNVTNHYHPPQKSNGLGKVASAIVGAALAAGTGGVGFGLWQAFKPAVVKTVDHVLTRDTDVTVGDIIVEPPKE